MGAPLALAERLRAGERILTAWSGIPDARVATVLGRAGYPAVTFDMQHGLHDLASVVAGIPLAVAAGAAPIVRVPVGEFATASRVLDAGAVAVIAPMIDGAETARRFVAHLKYPPIGERSWGPTFAMALAGVDKSDAWLAGANAASLGFAMIESADSIAALDDILAVDGLDGIFVGPSDLSLTLSGGARLAPSAEETWAAVERIGAAALAAGKLAALFANTAEDVRRGFAAGYRLIAYGTDTGLLKSAATEALTAGG